IGDVIEDVLAGAVERRDRDIDRLVDHAPLQPDCRREKNARLGGGARSKLDERKGLAWLAGGRTDDLIRVGREDGALDAGQVVLGQRGDLLEEMRTCLVVEEPGRKGLLSRGSRGQTRAGFAGYCFRNGVKGFRSGSRWHVEFLSLSAAMPL